MHTVNFPDDVYQRLKQDAIASGVVDVDQYIVDIVSETLPTSDAEMQKMFTVERMALVERAHQSLEAGNYRTPEQLTLFLAERRAEWLKDNPQ